MTPEEHEAWREGVRRWARERAEREPRDPPALYVAYGDEVRDSVVGASFFAPRGLVAAWEPRWAWTIPTWCHASPNEAAEEAASRRMALVRDNTSPDGWRLVDLEVSP